MHNKPAIAAIFIAAFALSTGAQTVTGSGNLNTIPMFTTGTSTIGNSAITQSSTGDVEVNGNSSLRTTFQVNGSATIGTEMDLGNSDTGGKNWGWVSNGNAYPTYPPETSGCMSLHDVTDGSYPAEFCQTFITLFQNVGIGTTTPGAALEVNGNVKLTAGSGASVTYADGSVQTTAWNGVLNGGDYAESVNISGDRSGYEPGDIIVISAQKHGTFTKSAEPYSKLVAGIYSTKPGLLGRRQPGNRNASTTEIPMAMIGIVPTKVNLENGPIKDGDLLVTSSTPGVAMKGTDSARMLGAVIGKAMDSLDSGTGVIEVLVRLQ